MPARLSEAEHRARHVLLHGFLDEVAADYFIHHRGSMPSNTTVMQLIAWSHVQTTEPAEIEERGPGIGKSGLQVHEVAP